MSKFKVWGIILMIFVVLVLMVPAGWAIKYFTADIRGRIEANETIKSGDNRIAQYDHFFNLCASVQADEARLEALKVELEKTPDDVDKSRLLANITGVTSHRARIITQYNADAAKNYTSGQFRDSNLPYRLHIEDENTTCVG